MIVAVPAATPVTMPVEPIDATPGALLDQAPPEVVSDNVVVELWQIPDVPEIGAGSGFTVNTLVAVQPDERVYEIIAVPTNRPVTVAVVKMPETDATEELPLLHVPPGVISVKEEEEPAQTSAVPVTDEGVRFTVIAWVATHPPVSK